jgi:hypothetical protein
MKMMRQKHKKFVASTRDRLTRVRLGRRLTPWDVRGR